MRYLKIGASALVALVLVGLIAVIAHDRMSQPPAPDRAALIAKAAHYHARIQRDRFRRAAHLRPDRSPMWRSAWASPIPRTISPPSRTRRWPRAAAGERPGPQGGGDGLSGASVPRMGDGRLRNTTRNCRPMCARCSRPMPTA